ncbi:UNVERIFIED_CONTAM: hypothetical protein K2H54_058472 [Gekko kuhli]
MNMLVFESDRALLCCLCNKRLTPQLFHILTFLLSCHPLWLLQHPLTGFRAFFVALQYLPSPTLMDTKIKTKCWELHTQFPLEIAGAQGSISDMDCGMGGG